MILPQSYVQGLILLILGAICWASWANTFKLTKSRYELFYLDVAIGMMLMAIIYAFTVGNLGFDGFSVLDDLSHAGKRQWLFGFLGGAALNFGSMLIFAALSVAGMTVAYSVGLGLGLVLGVFVPQVIQGTAHRGMMLAGIACSLAAMVLIASSYSSALAERFAATPRDPKKKPVPPPSALKGLLLCIGGGVIMTLAFPLFEKSRQGDFGMGPYSIGLMMAVGALACTGVVSLFLMNLPVEGEPVELVDYFRGRLRNHLMGWIGGMIWCTGTIAVLVVNAASAEHQLGLPNGFTFLQAAPFLGGLYGALVWKEYGKTRSNGKVLLALLLMGAGAALLLAAPATARS